MINQRGTDCDFIAKARQPQTMTPDWNYNPGKAQFLSDLAGKLNRASPAGAREAIKDTVNSPGFEAAFQSGDVRDWPVAILPDDVAQTLRKHGLEPPRQIITDGIASGKLARKHPKVSVEQYQTLQRALDRGGVYLQAPGKRRKKPALLAEYQDDKGQWWFYAINLENLRTRTIFDSSKQHRAKKLTEVTIIREWDPRWWGKK